MEEKKYITLENLAYFLEKFKKMMAGEDKNENIEGNENSQGKGDKE